MKIIKISVDKRIAIIIILLLILVNVVFFSLLLNLHVAKKSSFNQAEDIEDVIFVKNGNDHLEEGRADLKQEDPSSVYTSGTNNQSLKEETAAEEKEETQIPVTREPSDADDDPTGSLSPDPFSE